ncbi:hypothetical protein L0F63_006907, partial [Massospora cicadina]
MTTTVKKDSNPDLYESDPSRSMQIPYNSTNYSQESSTRSNLDRARWSEQDMEILFGWFQDPQNLASYTTGIKAKAMRAMAEKIPGKTDRQILNKMTALENHYHQCKARLKQGIPLTERDLECGIDSAQAKVKSIFRYYYEMDQILGSQPQSSTADNGYNNLSRADQTDYDSPRANASNGTPQIQQISHHSMGERGSPLLANTSNRASFPTSGGYTPEAYPHETYTHDSFTQPKYASHATSSTNARQFPLDSTNDPLPRLSSARSEGHSYHSRDVTSASNSRSSRRDLTDSYLNLAPLDPRHGSRSHESHVAKDKIVHSSKSSSSTHERRIRIAEEKLAFKRARHEEIMSLAYRQFEAEEEARRFSQRQHEELLNMRKLEYQIRSEELALEKLRLGITSEFKTLSLELKPNLVVSPADESHTESSNNLDIGQVHQSLSQSLNESTE